MRLHRVVADGGRARLGDQRAMLRAVHRVAAREQGRAGELRVGNLVIVEAAFLEQLVAGADREAVEPPFLAAEDQVRARDAADAGRLAAMAVIERDRDRLRRDDAAELRKRGRNPRPNGSGSDNPSPSPSGGCRGRARLPELAAADILADALLDIAEVQLWLARSRTAIGHSRFSLSRLSEDEALQVALVAPVLKSCSNA